ncbi:MAG TPA: 4'-phosphopantetheinyl transferase superfamily protein [Draconibacterium sp.]|nr:4'-phosphopantetheinyl transferase superfamily protein [Draconibacterium sp.]
MGFYRKIETNDGLIGIWKLEEKPEELLNQVQLSTNETLRFSQIKFERRQAEFLATRLLLNKLLDAHVRIGYEENGKPFLKDHCKNISISHSINFVCVFISKKNIGIDVELSTRPIDRVANRFLHPNELEYISGLRNPQLAKIAYWAAKEAIFKCSPEQGIEFSKQIQIDHFDPETEKQFSAKLIFSEKILNYHLVCEQIENNVLVYCVEE